jgi:hypothetical protein
MRGGGYERRDAVYCTQSMAKHCIGQGVIGA